jgi:glycosyltransferase involved in cell wall biosynthesis
VTDRVLLLTPSRGLGGGIERYADTLEWAFAAQGVECLRADLHQGRLGSRALAHARLLSETRRHLRASTVPTRLIVVHRALLPIASLAAAERAACGISVICHGSDVWGARFRARRGVESCLMGRKRVRVVAVSSFTAGAIFRRRPATILPPGLSREWFHTLVEQSAGDHTPEAGISLVTAFRLADWEAKGLPQLLAAVKALGRPDIRVTVCGTGKPPAELHGLVAKHSYCSLRPGLSDRELAGHLAAADLFVLATRTRSGRRPAGEGFGLVLLEAQVAGTPVIAPAYGGSHDAHIEGITGVTPTDETPEALATVIGELLKEPRKLEEMGKSAAAWARERFAPERYAPYAVARLL